MRENDAPACVCEVRGDGPRRAGAGRKAIVPLRKVGDLGALLDLRALVDGSERLACELIAPVERPTDEGADDLRRALEERVRGLAVDRAFVRLRDALDRGARDFRALVRPEEDRRADLLVRLPAPL